MEVVLPLCEEGTELSQGWDIFEGLPTSATHSLTVNLASKKQGACSIAHAVGGRPVFRPRLVHVVALLSTNRQCGRLCWECVGVRVFL